MTKENTKIASGGENWDNGLQKENAYDGEKT